MPIAVSIILFLTVSSLLDRPRFFFQFYCVAVFTCLGQYFDHTNANVLAALSPAVFIEPPYKGNNIDDA